MEQLTSPIPGHWQDVYESNILVDSLLCKAAMSLNTYIFYPEEFDRLYNCSLYKIDSIPLERRQHFVIGWMLIVLFVVFEVLYLPCIVAISKHLHSTSFKIMLYMGIADVIVMWSCGFLTGYFALTGEVYCSHPKLIFFVGVGSLGFWLAESSSALLLAFNRCLEVTIYALITVFFFKSVCYSSIYVSWFFNPHVGYVDEFGAVYNNTVHSVHNSFLPVGLITLYLTFCVVLVVKRKYYRNEGRQVRSKLPFIQLFLITVFNAVGTVIYVYMQYARIDETIIILGSFCWLFAHGMPAVVYLSMNKTIRKECYRLLLKIACMKNTKVIVPAIQLSEIPHQISERSKIYSQSRPTATP
ncbi:serpentine type 7TM GPCR chemoreceptor srt domain-containing protein [Ditylenchus destructor]|uniref:Serpentine type 7TM GPCR chemoreceptor srt domain-containing protein n=1 Tax=Ditylenchus destructor TaxID=166010 RepID=A0AAD4QZR1_9BILA|nr:serpentine type 7TM GPCR chemoreceptor srt domain-containing protein [Ditylenchus destructor]